MSENKLTIEIEKPVSEVFKYTINPENTPKWIPSMKKEEAETPVGLGKKYRNTSDGVSWDEFTVTKYEEDKLFELQNDIYGVRYTYRVVSQNLTELEYFEWMKKDDLTNPLPMELLARLKGCIEQ
jgi:uncharacterized protein YndB with AHSA1/START domain